MAGHEVWNFVSKFFYLCNTGKNDTLTLISSQHGKAVINLQLDLDDVHPHLAPQPPRQNYPSPSRARRTQRRAQARAQAAAENATRESQNKKVADVVEAAIVTSSIDTAEQAVTTVLKETADVAVQATCDTSSPSNTNDAAVKAALPNPDDHSYQQHLRTSLAQHSKNSDIVDHLQKMYVEVEKAYADFNEIKKLKDEEIQVLKDQLESLPALILSQIQTQLQPD